MNNDLEGLDVFVDSDVDDVDDNQPGMAGRPHAAPPVHGGVINNIAWTGGSRNPNLQVAYPKTRYCNRGEKMNHKVYSRCEKGVKDDWMIRLKMTMPLSTCEHQIRSGLEQVGVDSPFWIYEGGRWIHLYENPDAVPLAVIRRHEQELARECPYDRTNLHLGRVFLENCIDVELHRKMMSQLQPSDGGPVFWCEVCREQKPAN